MRLFLARHAQTASNVSRLLDTALPGPALDATGQQQARRLAESFAAKRLDAVFASPLLRAQVTAEPLASTKSLPVQVINGLREIDAGEYELRGDPSAHKEYLGTIFSWVDGDLDRRIPDGIDGHTFFDRFDRAIAHIYESGAETAFVVSHGAAIRAWASGRASNLTAEFGKRTILHNTAVVALSGDPDVGWRVSHWDRTDLPPTPV
jgi:probable phosphoglycerate mutase